jgi:hypothetical protein
MPILNDKLSSIKASAGGKNATVFFSNGVVCSGEISDIGDTYIKIVSKEYTSYFLIADIVGIQIQN